MAAQQMPMMDQMDQQGDPTQAADDNQPVTRGWVRNYVRSYVPSFIQSALGARGKPNGPLNLGGKK